MKFLVKISSLPEAIVYESKSLSSCKTELRRILRRPDTIENIQRLYSRSMEVRHYRNKYNESVRGKKFERG